MAEQQLFLRPDQRQFGDILTCSVCLDWYINPKKLDCHHTFCLKCIEPLPIEIKEGKPHIACPICRIHHQIPRGDGKFLPNAWHINSLSELQRELDSRRNDRTNCPDHFKPFSVYCETCHKVICQECSISPEHSKHHYVLVSESHPNQHQQLQADLDLLKQKATDIRTAVTAVTTREREVIQQGDEVKQAIHTHAQQLIDQVQMSEKHLLQQVDTVVQQKRHTLMKQREQAEVILARLKTCEHMIETILQELNRQQIIMSLQKMLKHMEEMNSLIEPTLFLPIESTDMKFVKKDLLKDGIGQLKSSTFKEATLNLSKCFVHTSGIATLYLTSRDDSRFTVPSAMISCELFSSNNSLPIKCDIHQTQQGDYNISYNPSTREDQLSVQVGGVDISGSPFILPVIPLPETRGEPVKTVIGLNQPWGIAVSNDGSIVVAERQNIVLVNERGISVRSFSSEGTLDGRFIYPRGVAISRDGCLLVTDNHRLQKLTFDGVFVQSVGGQSIGSGQLEFAFPAGIAVHSKTGEVFVADSENNRIQVFGGDLTFSHTIRTLGILRSFNRPYDVALDSEGCLYISECGNHCITKLSATGQYMSRFGTKGSAPGQLYRPSGLCVNDNLVYVVEDGGDRVSIFDVSGKFVYCFGRRGSKEGELRGPHGVTVDALGNLFVSDTDNYRIVVF